MDADQALALREPFPASAIGKLPKAGTTLDYVGHAAVTDRLLVVDPAWTWEPLALAADGGPLVRIVGKDAELWIRLTVCGLTRIGVGTAPAGSFELSKQLASDAIRNAAMRFGVALDLWAKEDLHEIANPPPPIDYATPDQTQRITTALDALDQQERGAIQAWWRQAGLGSLKNGTLTAADADVVLARLGKLTEPAAS